MRVAALLLAGAAVAFLGVGYGASGKPGAGLLGARVQTCAAGAERPLGSPSRGYAATARRPTTAYRMPGGDRVGQFGLRNVNGARTVFGVVGVVLDGGCRPAWWHVQLPLRPNGTRGYVAARDVKVGWVRTRLEVDLGERTVTLLRDGKPVLLTVAAIGSSATPTPTGRFYVDQRVVPPDAAGPFGPGAIGIAAYSPVLTGWAQGGPIAIHGTNQPWSIGKAVSNGCLRVRNAVLRRLFAAAPAGTPVIIHV